LQPRRLRRADRRHRRAGAPHPRGALRIDERELGRRQGRPVRPRPCEEVHAQDHLAFRDQPDLYEAQAQPSRHAQGAQGMTRRRSLALAALALGLSGAASSANAAASPVTWHPWLLSSPSQFRLGPPPAASSARTKRDLRTLLAYQRRRTPAERALVAKWVKQPSVVPWMQEELQSIVDYRPRVAPAAR